MFKKEEKKIYIFPHIYKIKAGETANTRRWGIETGGRPCIILNCETCDLVFCQKNKYNLNFKVFSHYFSNKNERKYKIGLYLKKIKIK